MPLLHSMRGLQETFAQWLGATRECRLSAGIWKRSPTSYSPCMQAMNTKRYLPQMDWQSNCHTQCNLRSLRRSCKLDTQIRTPHTNSPHEPALCIQMAERRDPSPNSLSHVHHVPAMAVEMLHMPATRTNPKPGPSRCSEAIPVSKTVARHRSGNSGAKTESQALTPKIPNTMHRGTQYNPRTDFAMLASRCQPKPIRKFGHFGRPWSCGEIPGCESGRYRHLVFCSCRQSTGSEIEKTGSNS